MAAARAFARVAADAPDPRVAREPEAARRGTEPPLDGSKPQGLRDPRLRWPRPVSVPREAPLLGSLIRTDPRSLAALRIGLGAILVADLLLRATDLRVAYTDGGVIPRAELDPWLRETIAPFHLLSGSFAWEAFLFALALGFALLLLLGCFTRVAAVASWLLTLSLQVRNPFLLNFGDQILRVSLFWALFLPLGRCWSIDAWRAGRPASREPECSVAGAAFLLQICLVYFFTAILKTGADWHEDGTALYYAMQLDWMVQPFGIWLREQLALTQLLTWGSLALESVGPILLLTPWWPTRLAGVLGFAGLHLGISATLRLGVFPWIDVAVLCAFVPGVVWDAIERTVRRAFGRSVIRPESAHPPRAERPRLRAVSGVLALLLAYVALHNVASVRPTLVLPEWPERALRWIGLEQKWLMFTPNVTRDDGWFVLPARLADGRIVDVSPHGPEVRWQKPALLSADFASARWARYLHQLSFPIANGTLRRSYVRWLCRDWNQSHPPQEQLERVDMIFLLERSPAPGGSASVEPIRLASHECPSPGARPKPGWDVAVPESGAAPPPIVALPLRVATEPTP